MYLSRLSLNRSRAAATWAANPYRVHQRLAMAFPVRDPRLLFRLEDTPPGTQILVQSRRQPHWPGAFADANVLAGPPECKLFDPKIATGRRYRFRLLANPCVKRGGKRLGLLREEEQRAWIARKLGDAGAEVVACLGAPQGNVRSRKSPQKDPEPQVHWAVLFEGILRVRDDHRLGEALASGIGPAKAYGFGLLSLAPLPD